jgi:hypothetical protein
LLNVEAPEKLAPMVVTAAVFQCPIFLLKLLAEEKSEHMFTWQPARTDSEATGRPGAG